MEAGKSELIKVNVAQEVFTRRGIPQDCHEIARSASELESPSAGECCSGQEQSSGFSVWSGLCCVCSGCW